MAAEIETAGEDETMEQAAFWKLTTRTSLVALALIIGVPAGCQMYDDHLVAELTLAGTAPMRARCAIYGNGGGSPSAAMLCMQAER